MAANRYGRIYHSDHHYINLRFHSVDARREFAEKFEKYHAGHDHDGEAPRFEDTAASTIGNMEANRVHDAHSVSIDGYATYEIEDYHNPNPSRWNTYNQSRYRPPTCCVAPLISVNRTFVDSSELTRHELSAIFMDMPEEDFENLLKSVEAEGFKDPVIRMIDTQVLDGWHRYRAAKELNLLRKLRFHQWDEKDEGDPEAFVYARNMHRRHLPVSLRSQIAVSFNERYGMGRPSESLPNGELKSRQELAKEAGVSPRSIDRAITIEKAGRADEVLTGEKSAGEIIEEMTIKELWKQINPAISVWKQAREGVGHASKSMFIKATLRWEGLEHDAKTSVAVLKELLNLLTTTDTNVLEELVRKQLDGKDLWGDASSAGVKTAEQEMDEQATEVTAESLWAQIAEEMPKWKARDAEIAHPSDSIADASESILIEALRQCDIGNDNEGLETVEELNTLLNRIETDNFPFIVAVRDLLKKQATEPSEDERKFEDEDEKSLEERKDRLRSDLLNNHWLEHYSWEDLDTKAFMESYGVDAETLVAIQREITAENPEPENMNALWEAFNKRFPKWKAKYAESGYKENDLIQGATEAELFDALRSYRHSDRTGPVTAEEIKDVTDLMKRASYPYARHLRNLLRDKHKQDFLEVDRCYAQNQLRVMESTISPLLERLGADDIAHHDKERLTADLYDVFLQYDNVPTEKEMIIALLDVVDSILKHLITRFS